MSRSATPVCWRDPLFGCAALAVVALTPALALVPGVALQPHVPAWRVWLFFVVVYPVLEAIIFRAGLHSLLRRRVPGSRHGVSAANAIASLLFALAHLLTHPPGWALATFAPALLFGFFYDRHDERLSAPIMLHMLANAAYFCLFQTAGA